MKSSEVLELYAKGKRDFSGVNLQGQSFIGQNLSGTNFSSANIQGTNFTNANLTEVNFEKAKAGLQINWKIFTLAFSWGCSWLSGRLVGLSVVFLSSLFNVSSETFDIRQFLDNPITFLLVFSISGTAIFSVALVGGFVNAIGVAISMTLTPILPAIISVTIAVFVTWKVVAASTLAQASVLTLICSEIYILLSAYLGWLSMTVENNKLWIRSISISLASWRGSCFKGANLTDANLSYTIIGNTDFRDSNITRTYFYHARNIQFLRTGKTYLSQKEIRNLVTTVNGENKNFHKFDLQKLNLLGANLQKADLSGVNLHHANLLAANLKEAKLIDADCSQANLQEADLSGANLVRVKFNQADLRQANLSYSCIQDWIITKETKLDGIDCKRVYLKMVGKEKVDLMPIRNDFKEGAFVVFLQYILDTIEIYHDKDINPRLVSSILKQMSKDYDESLEVVAIGKKGEQVFLKIKLSEKIEAEKFKQDYKSRYKKGLKYVKYNPQQLPSVNELIESKIAEIASDKKYDENQLVHVTHVEYIMSGNFAVGVNQGEVIGNKIAGIINDDIKEDFEDF